MLVLLSVGLFLTRAVRPADVPTVLIVYATKNGKPDSAYRSVTNYLANEFDKSGRVAPIVADITDPIYRQAIASGKIPSSTTMIEMLTIKAAVDAGRKLGAEYLFYILAAPVATNLTAEGTLYRQGRSVWKDRQTIGMSVGDRVDADGAALSLASTWSGKLFAGPFKDLSSKPLIPTPPPEPGVVAPPTVEGNPPPVVVPVDWQGPITAALKANDPWSAVVLSRSAVDADPTDLNRRKALCDTLMSVGQPQLAAAEAADVATWGTPPADWRLRAAKAYLAAGDSTKARAQLNEAVAREPDAPETRRLLAQIALVELEPLVAIEHLDVAIRRDANPDGYVLRAIARAMLGGLDGLISDWHQAKRMPKFDATARYKFAMPVLDRVTAADITETRDLLARCVVNRTAPANAETRDRLEKRVKARLAYLAETGVPVANTKSFDRFGLVQRVLVQSLQSVADFLDNGDTDTATEARIDLGEALKQLNTARELFAAENEAPVK